MLANGVIPAFFPHSLATLLCLVAIAAIEGWFVRRHLHLSFATSYRHSFWANFMSTIAGIPIAWLLWVIGLIPVMAGTSLIGIDLHPGVEYTLLGTVWFGGGFSITSEWGHVGASAGWILMLVPYWLGSVWIERRTLTKLLPGCNLSELSKAVIRGNLATYGIFLVLGILQVSSSLADLPERKARFERERQEQAQPPGAVRGDQAETMID